MDAGTFDDRFFKRTAYDSEHGKTEHDDSKTVDTSPSRFDSVLSRLKSITSNTKDFLYKERELPKVHEDDSRAMRLAKNMLRGAGVLGKVAFDTVTTVTGTKILHDLPMHVLQRIEVKKNKQEILDILSGTDELDVKIKDVTSVLERATKAKKLSPQEHESLIEQLSSVAYGGEKIAQEQEAILDNYLRAKTSGMQVVRQGLNSLFVVSGAQVLRAGAMLTLKGVETYQASKHEAKIEGGSASEIFKAKFKEGVLRTATLGAKSTEQNRSGWKKFQHTAQAFGTIATIFGIGSAAAHEFATSGVSGNLSNIFERIQRDGVGNVAAQNFNANAERMMNTYSGGIFKQLKNSVSGVYNRFFGTSESAGVSVGAVTPSAELISGKSTMNTIDLGEEEIVVQRPSSAIELPEQVISGSPDHVSGVHHPDYDRVRSALITPHRVPEMSNSAPTESFKWEVRPVDQFMDPEDIYTAKREEMFELAQKAMKAGVSKSEAFAAARDAIVDDLVAHESPYTLRKMGFVQRLDGSWKNAGFDEPHFAEYTQTVKQVEAPVHHDKPVVIPEKVRPSVSKAADDTMKKIFGSTDHTEKVSAAAHESSIGKQIANPETTANDTHREMIETFGKGSPDILKKAGYIQKADGSWTHPDMEHGAPEKPAMSVRERIEAADRKSRELVPDEASTVAPKKVERIVRDEAPVKSAPVQPTKKTIEAVSEPTLSQDEHREMIETFKDSAPDILKRSGYIQKADGTWTHPDLESGSKKTASVSERIREAYRKRHELED